MSEDPFDGISNIHQKAYEKGYDEGKIAGRNAAMKQGFNIGITTAFKIGSELGEFYSTCELYQLEHETTKHNERALNLSRQICELIDNFDMLDCHKDDFGTTISSIKDKYKQFCSITSTKPDPKKNNLSHLSF